MERKYAAIFRSGFFYLTAAAIVVFGVGKVAAQQLPAPPEGSSKQVLLGAQLYQQNCALCHGVKGRDATVFPQPIWGAGTAIAKFNDSKGLFEYLQMLMPFDNPAKLTDEQKTAITAYMMVRHQAMKASATLAPGGDATKIK